MANLTDEQINKAAKVLAKGMDYPGEHYAGSTLEADALVKHDIVLLAARPDRRMTWQEAMEWAASVGGQLPDRQEQALLFANCKAHLPGGWHWSSEEHENASYAWICDFSYGTHGITDKSYGGCAVAVVHHLLRASRAAPAAPAVEAVTDQVQDAVTALIEAAREAVATIDAYDESDLLALDDDPHPPSSLSVVSTSLHRAILALARKGGAK